MVRDNGRFNGNGSNGESTVKRDIFDLAEPEAGQWPAKGIEFQEYLRGIESGEFALPSTAADLLYEAVTTPAPIELESGLLEYPFFANHPERAVYGMHGSVEQLVDSIRLGGRKKGVLVIAGSGAGKSELIEAAKIGFEDHIQYRNRNQNPILTIANCPIQETAINLLSVKFPSAEERKRLHAEHGLTIHHLCPDCSGQYGASMGDTLNAKVVPMNVSITNGWGIGTLDPKETKGTDQRTRETVDKIILRSNGGILELAELGLHNVDFLRELNDLLRGRKWLADGQRYELDNFIIAHATMDDYRRLKKIPDLDSFFRRFQLIDMQYNLDTRAERKIFGKGMQEDSIHISAEGSNATPERPHVSEATINLFAEFGVLSRLKASSTDEYEEVDPLSFDVPNPTGHTPQQGETRALTLEEKLLLYSGESVPGVSKEEGRKIAKTEIQTHGDGYVGISPADVETLLQTAVKRAAERTGCLDPITAVEAIRDFLDVKWGYVDVSSEVLSVIEDRLNRLVVNEIRRAYVPNYAEKRENLLNDYIAESTLALYNKTRKDVHTDQQVGADVEWLVTIEDGGVQGVALGEKDRKRLRGDILNVIAARTTTNADAITPAEKLHFIDAPTWLRQGIDETIFNTAEIEEVVQKQGIGADDAEHVTKYTELTESMKENGLCEHCVPIFLAYAKNYSLLQNYRSQ